MHKSIFIMENKDWGDDEWIDEKWWAKKDRTEQINKMKEEAI